MTALALFYFSFKPSMTDQEMLAWSNKCLTESYDPSGEAKLKKWDITLTDDDFLRLRKVFANGMQEYYSFKMRSFSRLNYLGTSTGGTLQFKTDTDDVIVQTYNDPKGDVDSMATELIIPVKNIEPERLDSLQTALTYFKKKDQCISNVETSVVLSEPALSYVEVKHVGGPCAHPSRASR